EQRVVSRGNPLDPWEGTGRCRRMSCERTVTDWQSVGAFPTLAMSGIGGMYRPGDRGVYTASKHSRHPGPRAEQVTPERHGEGYFYDVRKYWLVRAIGSDGTLTVLTPPGKERALPA